MLDLMGATGITEAGRIISGTLFQLSGRTKMFSGRLFQLLWLHPHKNIQRSFCMVTSAANMKTISVHPTGRSSEWTLHRATGSHTNVWMPCGHILQKICRIYTAGEICSKHFWSFFLECSLQQRVRKCPTIIIHEAAKLKGKIWENTQPWKRHSQKMTHPANSLLQSNLPSMQRKVFLIVVGMNEALCATGQEKNSLAAMATDVCSTTSRVNRTIFLENNKGRFRHGFPHHCKSKKRSGSQNEIVSFAFDICSVRFCLVGSWKFYFFKSPFERQSKSIAAESEFLSHIQKIIFCASWTSSLCEMPFFLHLCLFHSKRVMAQGSCTHRTAVQNSDSFPGTVETFANCVKWKCHCTQMLVYWVGKFQSDTNAKLKRWFVSCLLYIMQCHWPHPFLQWRHGTSTCMNCSFAARKRVQLSLDMTFGLPPPRNKCQMCLALCTTSCTGCTGAQVHHSLSTSHVQPRTNAPHQLFMDVPPSTDAPLWRKPKQTLTASSGSLIRGKCLCFESKPCRSTKVAHAVCELWIKITQFPGNVNCEWRRSPLTFCRHLRKQRKRHSLNPVLNPMKWKLLQVQACTGKKTHFFATILQTNSQVPWFPSDEKRVSMSGKLQNDQNAGRTKYTAWKWEYSAALKSVFFVSRYFRNFSWETVFCLFVIVFFFFFFYISSAKTTEESVHQMAEGSDDLCAPKRQYSVEQELKILFCNVYRRGILVQQKMKLYFPIHLYIRFLQIFLSFFRSCFK